ncbi:MAG: hypothetical protein SVT56_13760 [Chloroflexota bacterium]|nr:hypothetical protein [Chloroflexota bacterium]
MKKRTFTWWVLLPVILSILGSIGYNLFLRTPSIVVAQGGTCSRPDLAPAPDTLESSQPAFTDIANTLESEADLQGWPYWVLKTIAKKESNWRQVDKSQNTPSHCEASGGDIACTCASPSGDYGIMQLNWSVHNSNMNWDRVQQEYDYNIAQGAKILSFVINNHLVNQGDLSVVGNPINWYLKLWGYNGYSSINNPDNDLLYNPERNWENNTSSKINCPKPGDVYTYQEEVLYRAKCEPNVDGEISWPTIGNFPLPDDELFATDLPTSLGPQRDILIFDAQASDVCPNSSAMIDYTLDTFQFVSTVVVIRNNGPGAAAVSSRPCPCPKTNGTAPTMPDSRWRRVNIGSRSKSETAVVN